MNIAIVADPKIKYMETCHIIGADGYILVFKDTESAKYLMDFSDLLGTKPVVLYCPKMDKNIKWIPELCELFECKLYFNIKTAMEELTKQINKTKPKLYYMKMPEELYIKIFNKLSGDVKMQEWFENISK